MIDHKYSMSDDDDPRIDNNYSRRSSQQVTVVDVKMPFMSMVAFMVKWAIASIPAFIILLIIFTLVVGILGSILNTHHLM